MRWKLYVTLLHTKQEHVRKAALKCFAVYTTRAWIGWVDATHRAKKLRTALAARQVSSGGACCLHAALTARDAAQ